MPHRLIPFALALLFLPAPAWADITGQPRVIDGDTLVVDGHRIRLHGIDAPESRQLCRRDGKPWRCGEGAANALAGKIDRRPVTCEERDRDRYGRIVAVCYAGGEDLNAWIVSQGLALAYRRYSMEYVDQEADAQLARRGVWGTTSSGRGSGEGSNGSASRNRALCRRCRAQLVHVSPIERSRLAPRLLVH